MAFRASRISAHEIERFQKVREQSKSTITIGSIAPERGSRDPFSSRKPRGKCAGGV
jgi:hypothetical protein